MPRHGGGRNRGGGTGWTGVRIDSAPTPNVVSARSLGWTAARNPRDLWLCPEKGNALQDRTAPSRCPLSSSLGYRSDTIRPVAHFGQQGFVDILVMSLDDSMA